MLWLVHLFSGFTAIGRLFDRERSNVRRYLQWTASPLGLILGKLFHAVLTTTALTAVVLGAFLLFLGWPQGIESPGKPGLLVLGAWLGGLSMTTTLVFVSAVASQVRSGSGALAAVLGPAPCSCPSSSWPHGLRAVLWPMNLGPCWWNTPLFLGALGAGTATIACILFPYIWRA